MEAERQVLAALESSLAIASDDTTITCIEVLAAVAARRGERFVPFGCWRPPRCSASSSASSCPPASVR